MAEVAVLRRPRREWLAEAATLMGFALVVAWLAAGGRLAPVVARPTARAAMRLPSIHPHPEERTEERTWVWRS